VLNQKTVPCRYTGKWGFRPEHSLPLNCLGANRQNTLGERKEKEREREREIHPCRKSNADSIFPNRHHLLHTDFFSKNFTRHLVSLRGEKSSRFPGMCLVRVPARPKLHTATLWSLTQILTLRLPWKNRTSHSSSFANTITAAY
jgi:hypothetical protein